MFYERKLWFRFQSDPVAVGDETKRSGNRTCGDLVSVVETQRHETNGSACLFPARG